MSDTAVRIKNINFMYKNNSSGTANGNVETVSIFKDFSMELPSARVSVILGPSGCGKTTLLNLISDLLEPQAGSIERNGNGNISVLFQEPRLLPWRSVRRNIEIVLNNQLGQAGSARATEHYLKLVGLGDYMDYYPADLSGGMRQRAAIARAFAYPADTILMDEPFQALDLGLKISLTNLFTKLWVEDRRTSIFVTHDINEAILLGDEIFVLSAERPVRVVEHLTNPQPHAERSLDCEHSIEIEKRLYKLLT